jgi:hypothetical protein
MVLCNIFSLLTLVPTAFVCLIYTRGFSKSLSGLLGRGSDTLRPLATENTKTQANSTSSGRFESAVSVFQWSKTAWSMGLETDVIYM